MSMFKLFSTSKDYETKGVTIDYGSFRVLLARAGGANERFAKRLEALTKPHRRAIQTETIDANLAQDLYHRAFAETCILGWDRKNEDGTWSSGIEASDGSTIAFNLDNVLATFKALPELFADLNTQAQKVSIFRAEEMEADAKNS
jgi:hypothetical protein